VLSRRGGLRNEVQDRTWFVTAHVHERLRHSLDVHFDFETYGTGYSTLRERKEKVSHQAALSAPDLSVAVAVKQSAFQRGALSRYALFVVLSYSSFVHTECRSELSA
jgi:hypothetical protein